MTPQRHIKPWAKPRFLLASLHHLSFFLCFLTGFFSLASYLLPAPLYIAITRTHLDSDYVDTQLPRLAQHPLFLHVHKAGGVLYLFLLALQHRPSIRLHHPALHRAMGYAAVALTFSLTCTAFYLALVCPYDVSITGTSLFFGSLMLLSTVRGVLMACQGRVKEHEEWMLRATAVAIGSGLIRVMFVVAKGVLGVTMKQYLYVGPGFFWCWVATQVAMECWIRSGWRQSTGKENQVAYARVQRVKGVKGL